jgi:mannosyltransferase OCH1-like enzyme
MQLIHQIVLGAHVPRFNRECLDSWRQLKSRGFEIVSWTGATAQEYLATCGLAEAERLYRRARNFGEASDVLRMAVTYSRGGWYVDWDVLLLDPDKFLELVGDFENSHCVLIRDSHTTEPTLSHALDNSLFYMRKGNPLAVDFLRQVERNYSIDPLPSTSYVTGPIALTRFLNSRKDYEADCRTIEMRDVYALDYEDVLARTHGVGTREVLKECWKAGGPPAIHFWTHAWFREPRWPKRIFDKLLRLAGAERG